MRATLGERYARARLEKLVAKRDRLRSGDAHDGQRTTSRRRGQGADGGEIEVGVHKRILFHGKGSPRYRNPIRCLSRHCLCFSPATKSIYLKNLHNRLTGKSVGRKTRTITPTGIVWPENLAQSLQRESCGTKNLHNRPNGKSVARKSRTITPTGSLRAENLAQTPHRKVCGAKDSHNRPNGKIVGRKTRTITPTGIVWPENLAQSAQRDGFGAKNLLNRSPRKCLGRLSAAGFP